MTAQHEQRIEQLPGLGGRRRMLAGFGVGKRPECARVQQVGRVHDVVPHGVGLERGTVGGHRDRHADQEPEAGDPRPALRGPRRRDPAVQRPVATVVDGEQRY